MCAVRAGSLQFSASVNHLPRLVRVSFLVEYRASVNHLARPPRVIACLSATLVVLAWSLLVSYAPIAAILAKRRRVQA